MRPTARSTTSWPSRTRDQAGDELIQLPERLVHRTRAPGGLESFLRGIEVMHDQQRLATRSLKGHRGHASTIVPFIVGPHEARVRYHSQVPAVERHTLRAIVAEHETVRAPDTNIQVAGKQ